MQVVAPKVPNTARRITFRALARPPLFPKMIKETNTKFHSNVNKILEPLEYPISPEEAKEKYMNFLNNQDLVDISHFKQIYYIRSNLPPCRSPHFSRFKKEPKKLPTHYPFHEREHIAFRYEQVSVLGKGTFGIVIKCLDHKINDFVAVKIVKNVHEDLEQIKLENDFLELFNQDNRSQENHIIKLLDKFTYRGYTCFVTELMATDLYNFVVTRFPNGIPKASAKIMIRQIACAIKAVHLHGYVHCDIKPENIMLQTQSSQRPSIRLIDFGCICENRKPKFKTVQSLYYRAPEVLYGFRYGSEIDVWSFGVLVFEMLTGRPLFPAKEEKELREMHVQLIGLPPLELVKKSRTMPNHFNINEVEKADYKAQKEKARMRLRAMLGEENQDFTDMIVDCLEWHPLLRPTIDQVTNYPCMT